MTQTAIVSDHSATPVAAAVLGVLFFSVFDAMLKSVSLVLPLFEVLFLRFAFGAVYATVVFARSKQPFPGLEAIAATALRTVISVVTILCFVYALTVLPLANAVLLSFSAPLFMVLFGRLLIGEPISRQAMLAILIGFAGIFVTLSGRLAVPDGSGTLLGSASALLAGACYALSMIIVRKRSGKDSIEFTVFGQNWCAALITLVPAVAVWQPASAGTLGFFALLGAIGLVAQFLAIWAFARAPAARLAPIEFTALIWAGLFGFVFFHEKPGLGLLLGAVLIVASGLMVATIRPVPPIESV